MTGNVAVTVNLIPTADAGGPYEGSRNLAIQFSGSGSDLGVQDVLTYAWDLDNDTEYDDASVAFGIFLGIVIATVLIFSILYFSTTESN